MNTSARLGSICMRKNGLEASSRLAGPGPLWAVTPEVLVISHEVNEIDLN